MWRASREGERTREREHLSAVEDDDLEGTRPERGQTCEGMGQDDCHPDPSPPPPEECRSEGGHIHGSRDRKRSGYL